MKGVTVAFHVMRWETIVELLVHRWHSVVSEYYTKL